MAWPHLFSPPIAHRGLWSPNGAPENSLAAFDAACIAGYGVELDVQLSRDGAVMVFHDDQLARMAGAASRLCEKTVAELSALRLKGTAETIPTLEQVLNVVANRVLVLVEIKSRPGEEGPLDARVAEVIADYEGPVAVIGFNPYSLAWWAEHRPDVLRGLNSYGYDDVAARILPEDQRLAFRSLEHVWIAKPHFLVLGVDMLPREAADRLRSEGRPVIAWTMRSPAQWEGLQAHCDNMIFEGFRP